MTFSPAANWLCWTHFLISGSVVLSCHIYIYIYTPILGTVCFPHSQRLSQHYKLYNAWSTNTAPHSISLNEGMDFLGRNVWDYYILTDALVNNEQLVLLGGWGGNIFVTFSCLCGMKTPSMSSANYQHDLPENLLAGASWFKLVPAATTRSSSYVHP